MDDRRLQSLSDARLVDEARRASPDALAALVERYVRKAYAVAHAAGADVSQLDDVVQESFLKAIARLGSLASPDRFGAWLLSIVRNSACSFARRRTAIERRRVPLEDVPSPERPIDHDEIRDRVRALVDRLPETLRETVVLYYWEGADVDEVARALGIARNAVLKRLQRGRDMLREDLWRELGESIRELVPPAREWDRRGRRLTLVLLGALPLAAGPGAAAGAAAVTTVVPAASAITIGGMGVMGKQIAIGAISAFIIAAALLVVLVRPDGGNLGRGQSGGTSALPASVPGASPLVRERISDEQLDASTGARGELTPPVGTAPALAGKLFDPDGGPVARAEVRAVDVDLWTELVARARSALHAPPGGDLGREIRRALDEAREIARGLPSAASGHDGRYSFAVLPAGDYRVVVHHPAHLAARSEVVSVRAGSEAHVDLGLARSLSIAGRVVRDAGSPVEHAEVVARPSIYGAATITGKRDRVLAALSSMQLGSFESAASSSADGHFELGGLAPDGYDLLVVKPGLASGRVPGIQAGATGVEIVLTDAAWVAGTVAAPDGLPVPDAIVRLVQGSSKPSRAEFVGTAHGPRVGVPLDAVGPVELAGRTDDRGRFRFEGLDLAPYRIGIDASGHPRHEERVDLSTGPVDLGVITLPRSTSVRGRVREPDGKPVANARVAVVAGDRGGIPEWGGLRWRAPSVAETLSDADGGFALDSLAPGPLTIEVASRDHVLRLLGGVRAEPGELQELDIELEAGTAVEGVVVDGTSGSPVTGAEVTATVGINDYPDPLKLATTGSDGRFALRGIDVGTRPGIHVRHADYPGSTRSHSDDTAFDRPLRVALFALEEIRGVVVDPAGGAAPGARVGTRGIGAMRGRIGLPEPAATSDAAGIFRLLVSPDARSVYSRVELVASHSSLGRGSAGPLAAPAAGEPWPEVRIVLEPEVALAGRVSDATGVVVPGALVEIGAGIGAFQPAEDRAVAGADGRYRLDGLERGAFDLRVRAPGFRRHVEEGIAIGDAPGAHDIVLDRGRRIAGYVLDTDRASVAGATVHLFPASPELLGVDGTRSPRRNRARNWEPGIEVATCDSNGAWSLDHAPDEPVLAVARSPGYLSSEIVPIEPDAGEVELVIAALSALGGHVVDASSGLPIAPITMHLRRKSGMDEDSSELVPLVFHDPSGRFRLDGLPPGNYLACATAEGYAFASARVDLAPGEESELRLALAPGLRVEGRVVRAGDGEPIPRARVMLSPRNVPDDSPAREMFQLSSFHDDADGEGRFAITSLAPGEYRVEAWHADHERGRHAPIDLRNGAIEPLLIELRPAGRLSLHIEKLSTRDHRSAWIVLLPQEGGKEQRFPADRRRDEVSGEAIPPGRYAVRLLEEVTRSGLERDRVISPQDLEERWLELGEVEIRAGETAEMRVAVEPGDFPRGR